MMAHNHPSTWWIALMVPICLTYADAANNSWKKKMDTYKPYRYVQDWTPDTLYIGPTFQYTGDGPVRVSLKLKETVVPGKLYLINTTTDETFFLLDNTAAPGTTVDVSSLTTLTVGAEVIFMYISEEDGIPRYTGSKVPGEKYFNTLDSDENLNPALRFGHRWSVAGKVSDKVLEFGFEDGNPTISDMDFNDIVFRVENLKLMVYQNSAKKRYYVW